MSVDLWFALVTGAAIPTAIALAQHRQTKKMHSASRQQEMARQAEAVACWLDVFEDELCVVVANNSQAPVYDVSPRVDVVGDGEWLDWLESLEWEGVEITPRDATGLAWLEHEGVGTVPPGQQVAVPILSDAFRERAISIGAWREDLTVAMCFMDADGNSWRRTDKRLEPNPDDKMPLRRVIRGEAATLLAYWRDLLAGWRWSLRMKVDRRYRRKWEAKEHEIEEFLARRRQREARSALSPRASSGLKSPRIFDWGD